MQTPDKALRQPIQPVSPSSKSVIASSNLQLNLGSPSQFVIVVLPFPPIPLFGDPKATLTQFLDSSLLVRSLLFFFIVGPFLGTEAPEAGKALGLLGSVLSLQEGRMSDSFAD